MNVMLAPGAAGRLPLSTPGQMVALAAGCGPHTARPRRLAFLQTLGLTDAVRTPPGAYPEDVVTNIGPGVSSVEVGDHVALAFVRTEPPLIIP